MRACSQVVSTTPPAASSLYIFLDNDIICYNMTQVCLLDSSRLSSLLQDALSWNDNVASLMVSAKNGSILAYAFRKATPSIKDMRTLSTTMTAAYTVASEDVLVFEAQNTHAMSVIAPIADHVLLAVNGPQSSSSNNDHHEPVGNDSTGEDEPSEDMNDSEGDAPATEHAEDGEQRRAELEVVSQELSALLREELGGMRWPEDI